MSLKTFLGVNLKIKNFKIILIPLIIVIVNCDIFDNPVDPMSKKYVECTITFDANGADGGTVPDSITAGLNSEVKIPSVGDLTKDTYVFQGWNTESDGTGTNYNSGDTLIVGTDDITLYAKWAGTYRVTYDSNTADSGTVPNSSNYVLTGGSVTIEGNSGNLVKDTYVFQGWNTESDGTGSNYDAGDIIVIESEDITLYATFRERTVGDIGQAGGIIFYDDEADGIDDIAGYRFLEAAPENISEQKTWGTMNNSVSGADGGAIGTGAQNTIDIIAGDSSINNAAHACADYSVENYNMIYDDWFLPSIGELNQMFIYKDIIVGFSDYYWSSTETGDTTAIMKGLSHYSALSVYHLKEYTYNVRPVRAFN